METPVTRRYAVLGGTYISPTLYEKLVYFTANEVREYMGLPINDPTIKGETMRGNFRGDGYDQFRADKAKRKRERRQNRNVMQLYRQQRRWRW